MKTNFKRLACCFLLAALLAVATLTGCTAPTPTPLPTVNVTQAPAQPTDTLPSTTDPTAEPTDNYPTKHDIATDIGEGGTTFLFAVTDAEGVVAWFNVSTDETIVGAALLETALIEGEDGAYGLMVKSVRGLRADFDLDGAYWAFYVDGAYAMSGVDSTTITAGEVYELRYEKA